MKVRYFILFIILSILISSCEPEDKIINNIDANYKFLFGLKTLNQLSLIALPSNQMIYQDIYKEINGINIQSNISRLVEFYNFIFVFFPDEYKIDVLDKSSFKIINTIDFSSEKKKPISICFPNISDAYIIFSKDSSVVLYDIFNFKQARTITAGKYPTSIAASGNQIYITNQLDNTVSIIDSRTHKVEKTIQLPAAPTFVDITPDGLKAVIISLGDGKIDSTKAKTAAKVTFIDVATNTISKQKDIASGSISASSQYPIGFSITSKNIGVIATKDYLFRIETKFGDNISLANRGQFKALGYNFKSDQVLMIKEDTKSTNLIIADPLSIQQIYSFKIDNNVLSILPL